MMLLFGLTVVGLVVRLGFRARVLFAFLMRLMPMVIVLIRRRSVLLSGMSGLRSVRSMVRRRCVRSCSIVSGRVADGLVSWY